MNAQKFIGMLVLDSSVKTDTRKVQCLMQTVSSVFNHTTTLNLITNLTCDVNNLKSEMVASGTCLLCSDTPAGELFVPAKQSSVLSWLNGTVVNPQEIHDLFSSKPTDQDHLPDVLPGKLLLRLNSDMHKPMEFPNYAHRVNSRLTNFMKGRWSAMSIFSGGSRSTVVIAKRSQELYFSLVHIDQCSLLFWGTEADFLPRLLAALPTDIEQSFLKQECFVNHITPLNDKNTLVLHPVFLLTKYRTWGERANFNHLRVFTVFSSYLERLAA